MQVEEDMAAEYSEEEEDEILHINDLTGTTPGLPMPVREAGRKALGN